MLGAPALYPVVTLAVRNIAYTTREYRLAILGLALLAIVLAIAYVLDTSRLKDYSTEIAFLAACFLVWSGNLRSPSPTILLIALLIVAATLLWSLRDSALFSNLILWASLFMWLMMAATAAQTLFSWGTDYLAVDSKHAAISQAESDIIVIVLDGFPSARPSSSEFDRQLAAEHNRLQELGFWIQPRARASYSITSAAIPSFAALETVLDEGQTINPATQVSLSAVAGGEGALFESFRNAGYAVTLVESGWSALRCVEPNDVCVARPWRDDTTAKLIRDSVVGLLLPRHLLFEWNAGIDHVLGWVRDELKLYEDNSRLDFVFLHSMLPHPPYVYDGDCQRSNYNDEVSDFYPHLSCAVTLVEWVAEAADGATIIVVGDHGSNLTGQMFIPVSEWSTAMTDERTHTLIAIRGQEDCIEPKPTVNTNAIVWVVRCLGADVPYVSDESLASSIYREPLSPVR